MKNYSIELVGFEHFDDDIVTQIKRNLYALISTPAGTCAGDRSYGIDYGYLDKPAEAAGNFLAMEIITKIETFEPRAELLDIQTSATESGIRNHFVFGPSNKINE